MTSESKQSYECKYCSKHFQRESSLASHLCEKKRRWQQEKETPVQFGLRAYLKFYEYTQVSSKPKSYSDFVDSPYYSAFVKFGHYCVNVKAINFLNFTEWLLKNNKKLDFWCKDSLYEEWLSEYIKKESVQEALERGLKTMEEYSNGSSGLASFSDYFKYGNHNRICYHITTGRISPWIVYNCDSGIGFVESCNETHLASIIGIIDPDFWSRKLQDYPDDAEWCRYVLRQAGL